MKPAHSSLLLLTVFLFACSGASTGLENQDSNGNSSNNTCDPLPTEDAGLHDDASHNAEEAPPWAGLVINEIAATGDPEDWFELFNTSDRAIDLTGYFFTDDIEGRPERGSFPDGTVIEPFGYLLFYMDDDWPGFKLSSDEELAIYSPAGELIDSVDWEDGQSPATKSFGRVPNGIGPFQTLDYPTKGAANLESTCGNDIAQPGQLCDGDDLNGLTCYSLGYDGGELGCLTDCRGFDTAGCERAEEIIVINEVTSAGDDEVELYNRGTIPVDLSGWYFTDDEPWLDDHTYVLESGTVLEPGDFLVFVKDEHHPFGLGSDDYVALYTPDGAIADLVSWKDHDATPSLCRIPDGHGEFQQCSTQTFGAPNQP